MVKFNEKGGEMMNLTLIRSGNQVFSNVEYIKGYAFKTAMVRGKSALLQGNFIRKAVLCSSFTPEIVLE
jgi:hypothetical protein